MDTVFGDLYTYKACPTVVSLEVTKAPGFEETLMDTVFGDSYRYEACPTVVSLEVTDTSTAETFQATSMIPSPRGIESYSIYIPTTILRLVHFF
jgi:hypothetical protein